MKNTICTAIGIVGGGIAALFGGWNASLTTLVVFMALDYISGLVVAGVFHNSPKSSSGALESRAGFKGLLRKMMILVFVLIGHRLDLAIGTTYLRDGVCIAYMANELLSIVENAGLMGIPIPEPITNAVELLKKKDVSRT